MKRPSKRTSKTLGPLLSFCLIYLLCFSICVCTRGNAQSFAGSQQKSANLLLAETEGASASEEPPPPPETPPAAPVRKKRKKKEVAPADDGSIDLSAADAPTNEPAPSSSSASYHHGGGSNSEPHFSAYFDLLLADQPGKSGFTFENFHPLLLFEIVPTSDLMFSFEVNPSPRYFELDYTAASWLQVRLGKIWIPFDDMNPHNLFGGIVTASRMRVIDIAYLPDIWTDLGVGAKLTLLESRSLNLDAQLYVVNGFGNQGAQPQGLSQQVDYPNFSDIAPFQTDNNTDKAFGGRFHALISQIWGVGFSFYSGRWTTDAEANKRVNMFGFDSQLRLGRNQIKLGLSTMHVDLLSGGSFNRNGDYIEFSRKMGSADQWTAFTRAGWIDDDDRIVDENNVFTVGGGLKWKPSVVSFSLEYYRDLHHVDAKVGYDFIFLRTVVQL